jgi:ferric-dicitrate binding protein FerR (iron transport regulator)
MNTDDQEKALARHLMMAVLDAEATEEQTQQFEHLLAQDASLRAEYEHLGSLKEVIVSNKPLEPSREIWDGYWQGVYRRVERGIGWILFSVGAILLSAFAIWEAGNEWIMDNSIPLWVRLAGVTLAAGASILMVSVIREKIFLHNNERYKDIER